MAVTKLWAVRSRLNYVIDYATNPEKTGKAQSKYSNSDYQALRDVLDYAENEEKTEQKLFCECINCNLSKARDEFIQIKEQFDKTDGIQAYHGYISFKDQDITPELAQKIGMEFAKEVWGQRFQVVVTTHLNTQHLHCHFVINSVSFVDGKRLWGEEKAWIKFRHIADRICENYQLHTIQEPNRSKISSYYRKLERDGMPTPHNVIREVIDDAVAHSHSLAEFDYILRLQGYEHCLSRSRKYWTIKPKDRNKSIRLRSLGEDYTNDRILERIKENCNVILEKFHDPRPKPRQYLFLTREDKIKKIDGLYGIYLLYCYKLGVIPKYQNSNPFKVHYALRDDLIKLDELTAQVTFLSEHNISTDEELFAYKHTVEKSIKLLTDEKIQLKNEMRTVNVSEEMSLKMKRQSSDITQTVRKLRKEVKLCESIAERSKVMEHNLAVALADEEKEMRKERKRYEQFR